MMLAYKDPFDSFFAIIICRYFAPGSSSIVELMIEDGLGQSVM